MLQSDWVDQSLKILDQCGPDGRSALDFIRTHKVKVSFHEQPTAARWTLRRHIQLHPRYADGDPGAVYPLSLIVHEARHLQQGFFTALSVYGELDAWQLQFSFLKTLTGKYHDDLHRDLIIRDLMSLSLSSDRNVLLKARQLMKDYAGGQYRIDLLPLFPLMNEIKFRLGIIHKTDKLF
jgi:hypothetical protein